jgi:hypothetical protein
MKITIAIVGLLLTFNTFSQVAPVGKKTLKVKQTINEEYFKSLTIEGLGKALIDVMEKKLPSKLKKYGFSDVTIEEFGKVANEDKSLFQVNIIDNTSGNKFKIRLAMFSKNPIYIIKEISMNDYPKGYFCKDIEMESDKFTNEINYSTPLGNPISYIKFKNGEIVNTYMRIEVNGNIPSVGSKGVIILFADGSKIEKPDVKINVEVDNIERGYLYTATFILNQEEIEKLTQKSITDVRLHIFDKEIIDGLKLQEYLKCISTL